jgi:threonine dehydrogenase-like Zn-dependent dehydrogenase
VLGIWLEQQRLSLRTDLPRPIAPPGEALVRVRQAGICNTDLELTAGYYPYVGVLGHEFVGEVVEGPPAWVGRRIAGEINAVCGDCRECRAGRSSHCRRRTVLGIVGRHGCFAEYLTLPVANLHAIPDHVADDAATFVEPLAAAFRIPQQVALASGDRALVVGDGKLGLLIAQTLALSGAEVLVVGRHPSKLALLAGRGIATAVGADFEPRSFDVAVDAAGNAEGFATALSGLRPAGTLVLKSTYAGRLTCDASALVVDEIRVVGSRCGPFDRALEALAIGEVDVAPLIQARFPLTEGLAAMAEAARPGRLKVLLEMPPAD